MNTTELLVYWESLHVKKLQKIHRRCEKREHKQALLWFITPQAQVMSGRKDVGYVL